MTRRADGSAGDADYGVIARRYSDYRRPDPRIAAAIHAALGDARRILNIGAGTGSYEPLDREVTAVEPSSSMRAKRPDTLSAAVDATAESLPFPDGSFDAAMTTFSVHQWRDLAAGLAEARRVTTGPVAVLTCDPARVRDFWLYEYAPEVLDTEARRYPSVEELTEGLGGTTTVTPVPVPLDCSDGFNEAYYGRPERFLEVGARQSCSAWSFVDEPVHERFVERLSRDLADGTWDGRHGHLRELPALKGSLVLVVSLPVRTP
ncbi:MULTISPECIES: class I SAM-dependent methyltransferase [unclassified Nocardiopsis]|uniref:class I SAM-dependent methyltransferase n=1 Tax=unclassified Nocardiopsis TaxID=2649073 RepID=UPI00135AC6C6|nr:MULTISPECIES: class I SAM-dependent methyltransferase [unclassified Nocardiopsis]